MKKIMVVGYLGKMGSEVFKMLSNSGYDVVGKEKNERFENFNNVALIIDFGGANATSECVLYAVKNKIPLIIGSTGHDESVLLEILAASKIIPVLKAGNFSLGIHALKTMLGCFKGTNISQVCVFEKHHASKVDTPSGTALEIKKEIEEVLGITPQISAFRGGKEVGTHEITLYFGSEVVSLSHAAFDRSAFACGVVQAVGFMLDKKDAGFYKIKDIFV